MSQSSCLTAPRAKSMYSRVTVVGHFPNVDKISEYAKHF